MSGKPFLDTNILLYAFGEECARRRVAEKLLTAGGVVSVQVLNEFVAVARRKLKREWDEVRAALDVIRVFCPDVQGISLETHLKGLEIAARYGYAIYDSLVIASALEAGSGVLYSEDLRNGQRIWEMEIRNPFAGE